MPLRDQQSVRPAAVAGKFYDSDAVDLRRRLAEMERKIGEVPPAQGLLHGVVLPHAGYPYSLETAMRTLLPWRRETPQRVILLGPPHYIGVSGFAAADSSRFRTPFGDLPLAESALDTALKFPCCRVDNAAHKTEHSLEVQFPLIQYLWREIPVLPLLAGQFSPSDAANAAQLLHQLAEPGTLFIVSSDLVHYGSNFQYTPWGVPVPKEKLTALDREICSCIARRDRSALVALLTSTHATVCGAMAILLYLMSLELAQEVPVKGEVVHLADSGEVSGNYDHVVGYGGVAFFERNTI